MIHIIKCSFIAISIWILSGTFNYSFSQQTNKSPKPIDWKLVDSLKKKIEALPDSLSYHRAYLKAIGWTGELYWHAEEFQSRFDSTENEMQNQYAKWLKQFPKTAAVYEAIGSAFYESESPKATVYLKKAIELNPKNAEIYLKLAIDAERWGKQQAAEEYMRLASVTDPENPAYSFYYAMYFDEKDINLFRQKIDALVKKNPEHERGAQGLYWLGVAVKNRDEKIKVYEELLEKYPPEKSNWSFSGMYKLFELYLFEKKYTAAVQLAERLKAKQGWLDYLAFAKGITYIQELIDNQHFKPAYDSISKIKAVRFNKFLSNTVLLEAELANKTGNTDAAYKKLVELFAKNPTDELQDAITIYAGKLNKAPATVKKDIWEVRNKSVKPAYPFELGLYTSAKNAKLSDYKGKVVLLTFWFPGCGPCRAEFPHFENVVKKFKGNELAYLGINVFPKQDDYVLPFMKGTNYSFTPLKATSEWAEKNYGVRGEPTNFLIDKEGNIVYANFRIDQENERTLELMINSLFEK